MVMSYFLPQGSPGVLCSDESDLEVEYMPVSPLSFVEGMLYSRARHEQMWLCGTDSVGLSLLQTRDHVNTALAHLWTTSSHHTHLKMFTNLHLYLSL